MLLHLLNSSQHNESLYNLWPHALTHLRPSGHDWAGRCRTVLVQGAVQHANGVIEIYSINCEPLMEIFTRREPDCFPDIALSKRGIYVTFEGQPLRGMARLRKCACGQVLLAACSAETQCKSDMHLATNRRVLLWPKGLGVPVA